MSDIWVIADIRTGVIVNDEYHRDRHDALDAFANYHGSIYTIMTEDAANELNLQYIEDELSEDIESHPEFNPDNEDAVEEMRREMISEGEAGDDAQDEGWRCR